MKSYAPAGARKRAVEMCKALYFDAEQHDGHTVMIANQLQAQV